MIKAVNYILNNDATISSLVGANKAGTKTKVYPVFAPNPESDPFIVTSLQGTDPQKNCNDKITVQVITYCKVYDTLDEIATAIRTALEAQAGQSVNGYDFSFLDLSNAVDGPYDKDYQLYSRIQLFEGY